MTTRSGNATGLVAAASAVRTRQLRPRQASGPGSGSIPAGVTIPRATGRVTRSSAALAPTNSGSDDHTVPQPPLPGTPRRPHKRPRSPGTTPSSRRAKRTRQRCESPEIYDDSDSGDEFGNAYMTPGSEVDQKPSTTRQHTTRLALIPKRSSPASGRKKRPDQLAAENKNTDVENVVIPNWSSLPYLILLQVFRYAAAPLTELQHARWLIATSGVCRAFVEPALTALYESPPLLSRSMAHGLVSLLSKDPSTTLFNYRPKVVELWIDVEEIASKTYKGQSFDLRALISNVPRLKSVQFIHRKDDPPYRSLDDNLRWHYPAALFRALNGMEDAAENAGEVQHTRLFEWQWNRRLMGPGLNLAGIKELHNTPSFRGLRKLSLVNFQVPSLHAKASANNEELAAQDLAFVHSLADAVAGLPTLEHLSIESSTAVNDQLLPLLPKNLHGLELVNCWDVNSDDLASFLLSSGQKLKQLILRHNQSLSLSFVTILGRACPNLQLLSVDLKTYNHHEFYHDGDPAYDDLLTADQIPDWPESLETIQLLNMKKWTAQAAENLFQSLVDNAPKLLKLRRLDLKAMLNIPIHERSKLRNKWDTKLKRVFLREMTDPLPLFSLRRQSQRTAAESIMSTTLKKSRKSGGGASVDTTPTRRSSRLASQLSNPSSRASSLGRDLRSGLRRLSYAEPDTDGDDEEEEKEGEDGRSAESHRMSPTNTMADEVLPFRHGMCEKVEILLDNQKTTERTLTMDDFLDSEHDDLSDDDWAGQDEDSDTGYAW
ncbi:hypothetical protein C8A03DRAFT_18765 [Achaetomium macrosporum]|uniref:F-box domain-containing protein n=1 Tax=Achaetomium macrosporum TaxID=79813 RepID=A0AAN7HAQ0_9PEZI|nr:hypothetical protein C8A03DRAFT_18765 [Achaetomium macrosporum]